MSFEVRKIEDFYDKDPETGFLSSKQQKAFAFDAPKKIAFLDIYRKSPQVRKSCESMGVSLETLHKHYADDSDFRKAYNQVQKEIAEELQDKSISIGLTDKGFMDRIAQLRRLKPAEYAPAGWQKDAPQKIIINISPELLKRAVSLEDAIDAEIVQETQQLEMKAVDSQ